MPIKVIKNRYKEGWGLLAPLVRFNLIAFWLIFSYGVAMKIAAVDTLYEAMIGVFLIMIFVLPLSLEVAMLLEFRGVDLFDYGSTTANRLRDQWLGKAFLRILLIGGNVALGLIFFRMSYHP